MKRQQVPPTDDWQQLQLLAKTPEQRTYELIRPVVLFGQPASARARETGVPQRTLYRQADGFDQQGMASLAPPPRVERHQQLPAPIRQAIIDLKREYAALNTHEITTICWARFGQRPSPRTVKRILAEAPPAPPAARRFPPYHASTDPVAARLAIIRLHIEGWNITIIAGYLAISRDTVYRTLQRWVAEGVAGLDDKPHARKDGPRKVDLRAIATAKELQENPELGEWRVHAALKRLGIHLSPRTCGRILALNRKLYGLPKPIARPKEPKPMPFAARRRHQIWSVDLRYLDMHRLGGGNIYVISILDNYSRAILASGLSRTQDLTAYLLVLYAAIRQHGATEALVSAGGGNFRAQQALRIYDALGIRKDADRAQAALAELHRDHLQHHAPDGRLGFRPGGDLGGTPRRARPVGRQLQLPGPLGAPAPRRGGAQPGRCCCPGCMGGRSHRRTCTASSTRPASGARSIASAACGSGTGGCTGSGAWRGNARRCGSTGST